ncbi:MAG: 2'-5' RNA ligase family protein [Chloroflexota bacterium]|nr:2'-5' RNA ligase family protein [Chloroflexota bacterium]
MEQDEAYRRIWQTFRMFRRLADGRHDTPDWRSHDGVYAVCCIRVPAAALQPDLDTFRRVLAGFPAVRIHPDHFLHIMLQELGFVCETPGRRDEISRARLNEFVTVAAAAIPESEPFQIDLGGANSFQDAAFLDVHDFGRCARLHSRLRDLAAITTIPKYAYLPHMTLAHYIADAPVGGMAATLADWRDHHFGTFSVTQVEVVTLDVDQAYPPLKPYAVFPLRG